ncbi:calcium-transporting ATPase 10, plasma membrane-type [Cinnamomum micranthum f. kanehirae]|uniref:Calcium-transporting ATPase n=1 Tax=Cinnamomum micranthum f. kanehirae TaxID=337451 RepID=A0A443PL60_9MAGN|nr:calcium-transporting ATPase 10, plasma membrane-type [Cinnamomum micranthum f. kanehirae]
MTPSSKDHGSSSSGRRCRGDEEQGGGVLDLCGSQNDTFSIPLPKKATIERLKKWRQATLVLNASRRFRYTLDLKKVKEKEEIRQKIRAHAQAVRVKGLASLLKTDLEKGIAGEDSELVHRRSVFGANNYPRKKGRSFWVFLWESWQDLTLIILMVAAAVSLALGMKTEGVKEGWYDGGSIAFAVLLVIFVTAFSDYRQSLQFQSLNEEKRNILLEVVRGGRRVHISIFDIVVGDVVPLKIGDQVPADGIFISGHSLAIDESSMTGESKIVHKDTKSPFLMSGCKVADGYGDMLVTAVGLNTEWGLLMASISEDTGEETPLQVRLNGVATFIGIVGLTVASFVLVVLLASATIDGAVKIVTIAVTIVVVAVPEGLPLAVTLTLAYSMRKMMVDKALVRRLSACETMGSATTICSDKTGTLTLNQMAIVEAYVGGKKLASPDSIQLLSSDVSTLLIEGIAQNTTGNVFVPEDGGAIEITGSPTEKAILSWGVKLGMIFGDIKSKSTVLHVFPFNSEKKRGGVALQVGESEVHIHWKGAAEIVLSSCTSWLDPDGSVKPMDQDKMNEFKNAIEDMAAGSLRCVAFAYRSYGVENVPIDEEQRDQWELPEDELVVMAIVGIKDPCRPGVKDAVQLCTRAGVKVRMVTGDNIQTAKAIALECGILDSEAAAVYPTLIEGKTFRALPDNEREEVAEKISVMGRSSPNDKLLLVKALRKRGHVVAVTGDGTNDAPALHEADIGLAMGIQGTEVAKESADIIILDDNFASVVKVVRWGRSVYANIQKFIQFQLTVNVAALIINVVAAVSSGNVPLNAVQLLWVNLIMDTLGALALATEPPTDHLMLRSPVGRSEPLITNVMWRNIIVQALYQVIVLLVLNFGGRSILHLKHDTSYHADKVKNTLIFNSFVICQVFNEFNARKPDEMNVFSGITRNHLFMGIIGVTVLLQVLIIEFLGKFAKTVRLSWKLWLVSIAIGVISWPLALIGKLIPVPETPFSEFFAPVSRCFRRPNKSRENGRLLDKF